MAGKIEGWGEITQAHLDALLQRRNVVRDKPTSMMRDFLTPNQWDKGYGKANVIVTREMAARFARGFGDKNPLYSDLSYAEKSRWGRLVAAPVITSYAEIVNGATDGFPGCHAIWRECEFEWSQPVFADEPLVAGTHLVDARIVDSRFSGGKAGVQDYETNLRTLDGRHVAAYRTSWHRFSRKKAAGASKYGKTEPIQWTDEQLEEVWAEYRRQNYANRRGANPLYFEDVEVGTEIPHIIKGPITLSSKLAFEFVRGPGGWFVGHELALDLYGKHPALAIRNEENVPEPPVAIHWTNERCQKYLGMPGAYEAGYERLAWYTQLVTSWCGDDGFMRRLQIRFNGFHWQGDAIRLYGTVKARRVVDGAHLVDLEVRTVTHPRGEETSRGTATVQLLSRQGLTVSALSHLRVVEYGDGVAAPLCSRLFADMGAEVTKVEPPAGDSTRRHGPFPGDRPDVEASGVFHLLNAGKKGLVADLDDAADLEAFHRLLAGADIFVESAAFADWKRWGFDHEALIRRHPQLVVVSISPYGRKGAWADRPGTDLTVQAVSSLPHAIGWPDRAPLPLPYDQADYQAGFHGFAAALCAVRERSISGQGQGIDISSAQVLAYQIGGMALVTSKRFPLQRSGNRLKGTLYPTAFFEAKDGYVCTVTLHGKQWRKWIELMGTPEWAADPQNLDAFRLGSLGPEEPVDIYFRDWLRQFTRAELIAMGNANDLIVGEVKSVDQVLESPQFAFREQWAKVPVGGSEVRVPKPGYSFSETPVAIGGPGPRLAADSAALRAQPPRPLSLPAGTRRKGALDGVRVLDFGWNWAGPMAGQLLADMGAEVIRMETSLRLDNMRAFDYASIFFCHNNRSKKAATFNVADPRGSELVRRLAEKCDIVMDNFAAGVMAKNGLGYADLVKHNPRIIAVSMSMAGQTGPERSLRGFASISSAYVGLEGMVGYPEENMTTGFMAFGLGDSTQAIQAVAGAVAALIHRERTGQGQFVDMSQIGSLCASLGEPLLDYQLNHRLAGLRGNRHAEYAPHGVHGCDDGRRWVAIAVRDDRDWRALCAVMRRRDWLEDPTLSSDATRRARVLELERGVGEWCRPRNRDEIVEQLCAAGVPAAPVLELPERNDHAAFAGRELVLSHEGGSYEPCRIYATPWSFTATPPVMWRPTPAVGEHNDYVHRELLGLDETTIARLREEKVLV